MDRNASASVMSSAGRRGLFRDIEPFSFGWLTTDGPHEI
jgi:proline iminopeptidase